MTAEDEDGDEDLRLLRLWREGDRKAGDRLISRHYEPIYRLIYSRVGRTTADAEEVTQRVFETLLHKRDQIDRSVIAYLRMVAHFKLLEHRRQRRPVDDDVADRAQSVERGVESMIEQRQEIGLLVRALRTLSISDQLYLASVYAGDKAQREISEELGMSVAQLNGRIHRARVKLRRAVEEIDADAMLRQSTLDGFDTWLGSVFAKAS